MNEICNGTRYVNSCSIHSEYVMMAIDPLRRAIANVCVIERVCSMLVLYWENNSKFAVAH